MKDRSVECGPATYVQCEFRHPATKTQDPREVHDHDRNITGKDTNPFSEGRETQLYYTITSLAQRTKITDDKLQRIQSQQMKALFPLVQTFDKLLKAAKSGTGLKQQEIVECVTLVQHSVQLTQIAFNDLSFRRRNLIKSDLKHNYRQLCNDKNPFGEYLLGNDLDAKMKEIDLAQKVGNKVAYKPQSKPRYHPYHGPPYQNNQRFGSNFRNRGENRKPQQWNKNSRPNNF